VWYWVIDADTPQECEGKDRSTAFNMTLVQQATGSSFAWLTAILRGGPRKSPDGRSGSDEKYS